MSDNLLEGGNGQGAQGQPTPGASGAGSVQQPSSNVDMPAWASQLVKRLDDMERRAQSEKDRGIAKVSKELETWRPVLEKVQSLAGLTPEQVAQVQREMEWDAMRERVFGNSQPVAAQPAQEQANNSTEKALRKFQLDVNDPEVVTAIRENPDPFDQVAALAKISVARQSSPTPSPASNAAPAQGTTVPKATRDGLKAEYTQKMQAARGNPALVRQLRSEYAAKGLDVENIGFGL